MARLYGPYYARVVEVHDGDTVLMDLDLGFGFTMNSRNFEGTPQLSCRVFGINAPELRTKAGKESLAFAKTLLPVGALCTVLSHGWDKYGGRFDGTISMPDGNDFAAAMLDAKQAVKVNWS